MAARLPPEIVRLVLDKVSTPTTRCVARLVCRQWNSHIVQRDGDAARRSRIVRRDDVDEVWSPRPAEPPEELMWVIKAMCMLSHPGLSPGPPIVGATMRESAFVTAIRNCRPRPTEAYSDLLLDFRRVEPSRWVLVTKTYACPYPYRPRWKAKAALDSWTSIERAVPYRVTCVVEDDNISKLLALTGPPYGDGGSGARDGRSVVDVALYLGHIFFRHRKASQRYGGKGCVAAIKDMEEDYSLPTARAGGVVAYDESECSESAPHLWYPDGCFGIPIEGCESDCGEGDDDDDEDAGHSDPHLGGASPERSEPEISEPESDESDEPNPDEEGDRAWLGSVHCLVDGKALAEVLSHYSHSRGVTLSLLCDAVGMKPLAIRVHWLGDGCGSWDCVDCYRDEGATGASAMHRWASVSLAGEDAARNPEPTLPLCAGSFLAEGVDVLESFLDDSRFPHGWSSCDACALDDLGGPCGLAVDASAAGASPGTHVRSDLAAHSGRDCTGPGEADAATREGTSCDAERGTTSGSPCFHGMVRVTWYEDHVVLARSVAGTMLVIRM